jgi:hypothetical protein
MSQPASAGVRTIPRRSHSSRLGNQPWQASLLSPAAAITLHCFALSFFFIGNTHTTTAVTTIPGTVTHKENFALKAPHITPSRTTTSNLLVEKLLENNSRSQSMSSPFRKPNRSELETTRQAKSTVGGLTLKRDFIPSRPSGPSFAAANEPKDSHLPFVPIPYPLFLFPALITARHFSRNKIRRMPHLRHALVSVAKVGFHGRHGGSVRLQPHETAPPFFENQVRGEARTIGQPQRLICGLNREQCAESGKG